MILVDTGPLVALFDAQDDAHDRAKMVLSGLREPLITTVAVLTEAFHLLAPGSRGARALREFVMRGGLQTWFLSPGSLDRAFHLMEQYADRAMDFADASLVAAAEALGTVRVFTIDRRDFLVYRARIGRTLKGFVLVT